LKVSKDPWKVSKDTLKVYRDTRKVFPLQKGAPEAGYGS
jgi:hypothetical protein